MKNKARCKGCGRQMKISYCGKCADGDGIYCFSCTKDERGKMTKRCPVCQEKLIPIGKSKDRYRGKK